MSNWKPTPKQSQALVRTEFEVLYGGARGGGKTDAGLAWLLYDIHNPEYRGLVIRKNAEDLTDWVDRAYNMYKRCGAVITGKPAVITFPSGAVIRTGHLKDAQAYTKYQGHEYHRMLIEELTQIPREEDYLRLIASCRSTVKGLRPQVFSTTNPGGLGHEWVRGRFIDVSEEGEPYQDPVTGRKRVFIGAKVHDNPYLMKRDPDYVKMLEGLPKSLREQWLLGSWDDYDVDGAIFNEYMRGAQESGRITSIPHDPTLPVETWWDLGYNDTNAIWFTQRVGKEIRFIDYYEDNFKSLKDYLVVLKDYSNAYGYKYQSHNFPHDFQVHEYTDGKSREEKFKEMMLTLFNVNVRIGRDYNVIPRVQDIRDAIEQGRDILPLCWFDREKCIGGIRALKNYRYEYDEKKNRYKDKPLHDEASHAASAFMQCAMGLKSLVVKKPYQERVKKKKPVYSMLTGKRIS